MLYFGEDYFCKLTKKFLQSEIFNTKEAHMHRHGLEAVHLNITFLKFLRIEGKARDADASLPATRSSESFGINFDEKPMAWRYFFITFAFSLFAKVLEKHQSWREIIEL